MTTQPSQAALDRAETLWWMAGEPNIDRAETITEMAKLLDAFAGSRLAEAEKVIAAFERLQARGFSCRVNSADVDLDALTEVVNEVATYRKAKAPDVVP